MPLDITFTLSDKDLEHFQAIVDKARAATAGTLTSDEIVAAARKLIDEAHSTQLPEYIAAQLLRLQVVINMLLDAEWQLGDGDRARVIGALAYFCEGEDIIPDSIPGLGFLDDAIYVELVLRELKAEIGFYQEFCNFRISEESRRREKGLDPRVNREEWLADKRASLHKQIGKRRKIGRGWHLRW